MSNVRISDDTHSMLRVLADREGRPMQNILDKAIEHYRRLRFWDDVEAAAASLRSDNPAWKQELAERHAWETTLADGLDAQ